MIYPTLTHLRNGSLHISTYNEIIWNSLLCSAISTFLNNLLNLKYTRMWRLRSLNMQ